MFFLCIGGRLTPKKYRNELFLKQFDLIIFKRSPHFVTATILFAHPIYKSVSPVFKLRIP